MSLIKENLTDIKITYRYVKSFTWRENFFSEQFMGHPRTGNVYRTLYNESTKNTKIIISERPDWVMLIINDFTDADYSAEMIDITKSNIVGLDLPEPALDSILQWMSIDNQDIKQVIEPAPIPLTLEPVTELSPKDFEVLANLHYLNPTHFHILQEVAHALCEYNVTRDFEISERLVLDPDHGLGVNITRALELLGLYSGDKKFGEDRQQIIDAIHSLVVELERRDDAKLDG